MKLGILVPGMDEQVPMPRGTSEPTWVKRSGLSISDATDLLDYLENHGIHQREVVIERDQSFAVRWRVL